MEIEFFLNRNVSAFKKPILNVEKFNLGTGVKGEELSLSFEVKIDESHGVETDINNLLMKCNSRTVFIYDINTLEESRVNISFGSYLGELTRSFSAYLFLHRDEILILWNHIQSGKDFILKTELWDDRVNSNIKEMLAISDRDGKYHKKDFSLLVKYLKITLF